MPDDQDERLRRIEEKLDRLLGHEDMPLVASEQESHSPDDVESEISADEVESESRSADGIQGEHPADLALSVRSAAPGDDRMLVCRAEIANYGEGVAYRVRWWLSSDDGDLVSTVAGGDDLQLGSGETLELEVVEIPGWENYVLQKVWCRLAWQDADGEHEKRRRYSESAGGMWRWKWKRPKP